MANDSKNGWFHEKKDAPLIHHAIIVFYKTVMNITILITPLIFVGNQAFVQRKSQFLVID